jgi:hypothetical protein
VTIICGSASIELESAVEKDKIDLGLARLRLDRRCTKTVIPIRAKKTTPPAMPPAIAAIGNLCDGRGPIVVVAPLAFIVCVGTLRKESWSGMKNI